MDLIQTPDDSPQATVITPEQAQNPDFVAPVNPPAVVNHTANMMTIANTNSAADIQDLPQNYNIAAANATDGSEDKVRTDLAIQQLQGQQNTLKQVQQNAALSGNVPDFNAATFSLNTPVTSDVINTQKQMSLEQQTADNMQLKAATTDPIQAKVVADEANDPTRDRLIKYQIYSQVMQKVLDEQSTGQSDAGAVTDFLGNFIPLSTAHAESKLVDIPQGYQSAGTRLSGFNLADQNAYMFNHMPLDQFVTFMNPQNPDGYVARVLDRAGTVDTNVSQLGSVVSKTLEGQTEAGKELQTGFNLLDVGTAADIALKVGTNIARVAKVSSDAVGSAELNAAKVSGVPSPLQNSILKGVPMNNAVTDSMPSAYGSVVDLAGSNTPEAITQKLEQIDAIGARIKDIQTDKVLTPDEINLAVEKTKQDLSKQAGNIVVSDVKAVDDPTSSLTKVQATLGKQDGLGWSNSGAANASLTSKGFSPDDYTLFKADDGRTYANVTRVADEASVIKGFDIDEITKNPVLGGFQKYVFHPSSYAPDQMSAMAYSATKTEGFIHEDIIRPLAAKMNLPAADKKVLNQVIDEGRDLGQDHNYNQLSEAWERFSGKPITDKQVEAYYAAKQLGNVIYHTANKGLYESYARQGLKQISFSNDATGFTFDHPLSDRTGRLGKVITENFSDGSGIRAYNGSTGEGFKLGQLTSDKVAELKATGYDIVKLKDPVKVEGKGHYEYIIGKRGNLNVKELNPVQLNYKPGTIGSRLYAGKWFVKQPVVREFEDGSGKYAMNPLTHAVTSTKAEATAWASKWNNARQAYKDLEAGLITKNEADEVMGLTHQIETTEQYKSMLDDGSIEDHPMGVYYDKEKPEANPNAYDMTDNESRSLDDYYQQNGRAIYSTRGDRLSGPQDENADVLNVYAALHKGTQNVIRSGSFDAYRESGIMRWFKAADEAGALKETNMQKAIQDDNPYKGNIDSGLKQQLELLRLPLVRQMASTTRSAEVWKATMRSIGEWIEGRGGKRLAVAAYDLTSKNPITAARTWAFDSKMGLFAPGQLLIHGMMMYNAAAVSPIMGLKAMGALPLVRMAVANGTDSMIDWLAKHPTLSKLHGMGPDEFKLYMKELQNSGITHIGGSVVYLQKWGNNMDMNKLQQGVHAMREYGRKAFFYEGELWNSLVSHGIAWREFAAKNPGADMSSTASRLAIKNRTDALSGNMMTNNASYWNKGILSWPTQFLSFHARLIDNMLPEILGGSKQFSGAEKARLAAGQMLFYGTAGIPAAGWAYDQINQARGTPPSEAEYKTITGGFFDAVLRNYLNADSSVSQRLGSGHAIENLWHEIATKDFTDVAGGPTISIGGQVYQSLKSAARLLSAGRSTDNFGHVSEDALLQVAKNISSFDNVYKAYWMYHANAFLSNTGKVIDARDYTTAEKLMEILSVSPRSVYAASDTYLRNQGIQQHQKEIMNLVNENQNKAILDGSPDAYERSAQMNQALIAASFPNQNERTTFIQQMNTKFSRDTEKNKIIRENFKLEGPTPSNQEQLQLPEGQ